MELTDKRKAYIDSLSYTDLLMQWRFSKIGSDWFTGPTGIYWRERMAELRRKGADHAQASKEVGWKQ